MKPTFRLTSALHVSHGSELAARPTASPFARRRGSDPERDMLWLEAVEAMDQGLLITEKSSTIQKMALEIVGSWKKSEVSLAQNDVNVPN